jgi:hypothetical protein
VGAVLAFAPVPASAQSPSPISFNHIITNNMMFDDCMRVASDTLRAAGLHQFGTTSEAVWGESDDRRYNVSIYCLRTRDIIVVTTIGPERGRNERILNSVMAAWRRLR